MSDFSPRHAVPGSRLARARMAAHAAFDPIWQKGRVSRSAAYDWLARELGLTREECHMLNFDEAMCQRVVQVCMAREFATLKGTT